MIAESMVAETTIDSRIDSEPNLERKEICEVNSPFTFSSTRPFESTRPPDHHRQQDRQRPEPARV